MTDYEKLKQLLTDFGVGFVEGIDAANNPYIRCGERGTKISGYVGFFTDFSFDKEGTFIEIGAWG